MDIDTSVIVMKAVRAALVLKGDRSVGRYFGDDK